MEGEKSERRLSKREKETESSTLGTGRLYIIATQPEPPPALPQARDEEDRGKTKAPGSLAQDRRAPKLPCKRTRCSAIFSSSPGLLRQWLMRFAFCQVCLNGSLRKAFLKQLIGPQIPQSAQSTRGREACGEPALSGRQRGWREAKCQILREPGWPHDNYSFSQTQGRVQAV